MPEDFEGLAKEVLADLQASGEAFWDQLSAEQRPIVEQAARDVAKATLKLITDPDNAEVHKETIAFAKSTLASEATLAALRASARLKEAVQGAVKKLILVGIGLLGTMCLLVEVGLL